MKYEDSGVNIGKGKRAMEAISRHVKSTWTSDVLSDTGAFGGLYALGDRCQEPVLVSSMDGVGTKIIIARLAERYDTVGQDLVNHCVNDILVQGARPLFFLDYIASGALGTEVVASIVEGISVACKEHGCALIGGETAEMPDVYQGEDFDLAGCIVGVIEKEEIIDGSAITSGDRVIALPSNGCHTNGYSLVRKIVFGELGLGVNDFVDELGCTVADEFLKIHASYLDSFDVIRRGARIKGMAHITGGGIPDNLDRILPVSCDAEIKKGSWPVPKVFDFLQKKGGVSDTEMYHVFNMGLGMMLVVSQEDEQKILSNLAGKMAIHSVGEIVKGNRTVSLV